MTKTICSAFLMMFIDLIIIFYILNMCDTDCKINWNICRQFEEKRVKYDAEVINEEALKTWVFVQSMPVIVEFSHETASKIFGGQIKYHLLLFLSKVRHTYYTINYRWW